MFTLGITCIRKFVVVSHCSANKKTQDPKSNENENFLASIFFLNAGLEKELWTKLNLMNIAF